MTPSSKARPKSSPPPIHRNKIGGLVGATKALAVDLTAESSSVTSLPAARKGNHNSGKQIRQIPQPFNLRFNFWFYQSGSANSDFFSGQPLFSNQKKIRVVRTSFRQPGNRWVYSINPPPHWKKIWICRTTFLETWLQMKWLPACSPTTSFTIM